MPGVTTMCAAAIAAAGTMLAFVRTDEPAKPTTRQFPPTAPSAPAATESAKETKMTAKDALAYLAADVGKWDAKITLWMRPGAKPIETTAKMTAREALGGKFYETETSGAFGPEMGNMAWTSRSFTGYNETTGEFEAVRLASTQGTMIVVRGKLDAAKKVMDLAGEYMLAGAKATNRDVITRVSPDETKIETFMSFAGSPEFKGAEMVLTRKK
jgi:hypothetical protein